jgi:hypothetical protein
MPGSPSFSWPVFRQRLRAYSDTVDWNVAIAFWLFGMSFHFRFGLLGAVTLKSLQNTWHRHFQQTTL